MEIKTKRIKRRGNGQGSVVKLGKNNWKAIVTIGYKGENYTKPIRRTKEGFKTKTEALDYIHILKSSKNDRPNKLTLKQAYDKWFPQHTASKGTKDCYRAGFKVWEDFYYIDINNLDIDELQNCLDNNKIGTRTRQNAKVALGLVFKWAIPRGYVRDKINLAEYLKCRSGETKHKDGFTPYQLEKIRNAIGSIPFADFIYCHCYLGFRPSALLDLKKEDYNFDENAFKGGIKTEAGKNRIVTVSPKIQPYINNLIENCNDGYIFGQLGEKMSIEMYRKRFYECLDAIGIQSADGEHKFTPHSCRHTFATMMKNIPAPDKDKLELIGHTSEEMLRYYQDVRYEDLRKITDKL